MSKTDASEGRVSSTITETGNAVVVALAGELDLSNAGALRGLLESQVTGRSEPLVLDLTTVTFMDSSALAVLIRIRKLLGSDDREFRVVCPSGPVLRLFTITDLVAHFGVHESLSEALASFDGLEPA